MKKAIITILVIMTLITTAFATNTNVTVTEAGNFHIYYNDVEKGFTDVNGTPVHAIVNEGTTYLPVRAASELVGLGASWDGETSTITLAASTGSGCVTSPRTPSAQKSVSAIIADHFTIIYNGTAQSFTDVNGKVVYPLLREGTTYLPIRALCNMLSIPIEWDGATGSIYLGTHAAAPVVTPITSTKSIDVSTPVFTGEIRDRQEVVYELDTEGYDFVRVCGTTATTLPVYLCTSMDQINQGNFEASAYIRSTAQGITLDVSGYNHVFVNCTINEGSDSAITSITLENAATIPTYSVPSGATALTDANTYFDVNDTTYSNGQFIRHNRNPLGHTPASIKFQNKGYSTIAFTVTTKGYALRVAVFQGGIPTVDALDVTQEANTTKTYTADISNLQTISVCTWTPGDACDSVITNMYVQ